MRLGSALFLFAVAFGSPMNPSYAQAGLFTNLIRQDRAPKDRDAIAPSTVSPPAAQPTPIEVGASFKDCAGCPEMVVLPAGKFLMGSPSTEVGRQQNEGPRHDVTLASYAMGKYEITYVQWDECVRGKGCVAMTDPSNWGRGSRPVMGMNVYQANQYAAWLTKKTGFKYFLPSESLWEYAARAGTTTPWSTGDAIIADDANIMAQFDRTVPVGSYPANAFGLHDMHGNVYEYVSDCYDVGYFGVPKDGAPSEQGDCTKEIFRGGSFDSPPATARSAYREGSYARDTQLLNVGFRVARIL